MPEYREPAFDCAEQSNGTSKGGINGQVGLTKRVNEEKCEKRYIKKIAYFHKLFTKTSQKEGIIQS